VIYLGIMFLVAATGVAALWVQQRRERAHLGTVDGFRTSLERLSEAPRIGTRRRAVPGRSAAGPRRAVSQGRPSGNRAPLDPARRAAARKRIEARRRAAARSRAL
jgi:hypothetical protein